MSNNVLNHFKHPEDIDKEDNIFNISGTSIVDGQTFTAEEFKLGLSGFFTDHQKFLGIQDILMESAGTWTVTRIVQGDYVLRKTAADDTTIIGIDITEVIRTTVGVGLRIDAIDYIFRNIDADLNIHGITLDRIEYADSIAVSVNNITLTGSLGVGQNADPQIDTLTVNSAAFNNTGNSKYVLEITVDAAATSIYDFIGVMLKFTKTDL